MKRLFSLGFILLVAFFLSLPTKGWGFEWHKEYVEAHPKPNISAYSDSISLALDRNGTPHIACGGGTTSTTLPGTEPGGT